MAQEGYLQLNNWHVYTLSDSRNPEEFRYIGVTNDLDRRLLEHKRKSIKEDSHKARWVRKVLCEGGDIVISPIACAATNHDVKIMEIALISTARESGADLVNGTLGGDGALGLRHSEDTKRKLSDAQMGRTHTDDAKRRMAKAKLGRALGAPHRAKIGTAHRGRKLSAGHRLKISAGKTGHDVAPETRTKIGLASRLAPPRSLVGFKGVVSCGNRWRAAIKDGTKQRKFGSFATPEDAARAYDKAAFEAWGRDCYLNFPPQDAA